MVDYSDKWLVETDWLETHLNAPDVVILDGNWYLPNDPRDPYEEHLQARIPGAIFFDIDETSNKNSTLPHMLPSPEQFSSQMRKLGIGDGMRVVVYDARGMFSAARVWWTFRAMGNEDIAVLNGGLAKWTKEGKPQEGGPPAKRGVRHFTSRRNADLIRDREEILKVVDDGSEQIVDARAADRFRGEVPEPRGGLRSGRIPGSLNLPYPDLLNSDGTLKPAAELKKVFEQAGVNLTQPVANTCGSGVTASIVALALAIIGHRHVSVYDGSWSEWGADESLPIETGKV
jgi:thiosulfate/3-mercaptopyruvate sulfurtransferase